MSIYGTSLEIASDVEGMNAPIVYQGSHVLPADTDERDGYLDLAEIASFIAGRDSEFEDAAEDHGYGWLLPWLRVGVESGNGSDTFILDEKQVRHLHGYLTGWIERVEATPEALRRKGRTPATENPSKGRAEG